MPYLRAPREGHDCPDRPLPCRESYTPQMTSTRDSGDLAQETYAALLRAEAGLEEVVGAIPADESAWLRSVQRAVRELGDALGRHRHLHEGEGGTIPQAVALKPALVPDTARLKHEHIDMLHRVNEIDRGIDRQFAFQDFDVELLRREAAILHAILELHLLRADALVYEAYFREEGGEGG